MIWYEGSWSSRGHLKSSRGRFCPLGHHEVGKHTKVYFVSSSLPLIHPPIQRHYVNIVLSLCSLSVPYNLTWKPITGLFYPLLKPISRRKVLYLVFAAYAAIAALVSFDFLAKYKCNITKLLFRSSLD